MRPYKPAMSAAKAYRIMLQMPGHFDAALLRRFIRVTGIHTAGSLVRLDDGSVGRVLKQTDDLDRPVVDLMEDAGGEPIDVTRRPVVDLTAPGSCDATRVVGSASTEDVRLHLYS